MNRLLLILALPLLALGCNPKTYSQPPQSIPGVTITLPGGVVRTNCNQIPPREAWNTYPDTIEKDGKLFVCDPIPETKKKETSEELNVKAYLVKKYSFLVLPTGMPTGKDEKMIKAEAQADIRWINENKELANFIKNNFAVATNKEMAHKITQFRRIHLERTTTGYSFVFEETESCGITTYRGKVTRAAGGFTDELTDKSSKSILC